MMLIEKKATEAANFLGHYYRFPAARDGLEFLLRMHAPGRKKILLPAYIGYSTKEGSGIFDPVVKTGIGYAFYRLKSNLDIDGPALQRLMRQNRGALLLLVHYFGFEDRLCPTIRKLAAQLNILVVDDYAHGLFTYFSKSAKPDTHALFSLHKMLPYASGGVLRSPQPLEGLEAASDFLRYDFHAIARKRTDNYALLLRLLKRVRRPFFKILRPRLGANVPQTFPLLMPSEALRDAMYFGLNQAGFGVVSLYHETIAPIDATFKAEKYLSRHILNLPIHQDTGEKPLSLLVKEMTRIYGQHG